EQTTLEYIAQRIVSDMGSVTGVTVRRTGSYIFFQGNSSVSGLSVTTDSGSTYIGTSRSSNVREVSDLQPRPPTQQGGYFISVGFPPTWTFTHSNSWGNRGPGLGRYGWVLRLLERPI